MSVGKVGSRPAFSDLVIESTRNQGTVTVISKPRTRRLGNLLEKKKETFQILFRETSIDLAPRFVPILCNRPVLFGRGKYRIDRSEKIFRGENNGSSAKAAVTQTRFAPFATGVGDVRKRLHVGIM